MLICMYDLRVIAPTRELAWVATSKALGRLQCLSIQDTPRKLRLDNGPWTRGLCSTDNGLITMSVTDLKWNKARHIIAKIKIELTKDPQRLFSFKRMERDRGFLCHMEMTYN